MTTSGSTSFDPVRETVVKKALRLVGAYTPYQTPTGNTISDAVEALNMMIKAWQIQNFMWVRDFVTLFMVPGQTSYNLPGANGATSYDETTTTADLVALDTVVAVTSSSGMTAADVVGVYLDSGSIHWDTIASVDSATQITLTTGVSGAATSGAAVFAYATTDALWRPTRIFMANRLLIGGQEIPLETMSRSDYMEQTLKTSTASPVQYYYDAQKGTGVLYLWGTGVSASEKIVLDVDRPLQTMIDAANTFDFPEEWTECIAYGLAVRLAPEYAVSLGERRELKLEFSGLVNNLLDVNIDWSPLNLGAESHG